ncbi:MAG: hypothetical protein QM582_05020 [Micropruina sp.]|uniref:hypothetical protein n=1 Tax=Micropruina sp. TaxID=2737536 RepID=UPI0039E402D5
MRAVVPAAPPAPRPLWVDAAPFRAHVRHTIDDADVPWPAIAVAGGVSVNAVRGLLFGRAGRQQVRIEPRLAARLLQVDARQLITLRTARVPAGDTTERLRELLTAGFDPLRLARWCHLSPTELALLVDGDATSCTRLTEALADAARRLHSTSGSSCSAA